VAVPLALSGGTVPRAPGTVPAPAAAGRASATPSAQRPPIHIVMPYVVGLGLKAAEVVIHAAVPQPDVIVRHVKTSGPAGIVIAQIPAPGAHVVRDKRITLEVSSAS
jgi:PASTA domain